MVKRFLFLPLCVLLLTTLAATAQNSQEPESLGLPGDNLNLYSALKLFQESETLERFEQKLNAKDNEINNLDLDGDGKTDYIEVSDNAKDKVHNIVLQVYLNKAEKQDVAVFIVSKEADNKVQIQVVGDEDLYGKDYIIEPNYDDVSGGTPNPGYNGTKENSNLQPESVQTYTTTYVQVATWPVIQYIYVPAYIPWSSPWHWGYYPTWWRPWPTIWWHQYYGYHYHWNYYYHGYYRRWNHYRYNGWYNSYYGNGGWRVRSHTYYNHYHSGRYRNTYSRPETLNKGSQNFKAKYPTAPSANTKLPTVKVPEFKKDLVKPPVSRPTPDVKPGVTKPPVTRPLTPPMSKQPVTKPVTPPTTKPPVTRPVTPPTTQPPVTRPVAPPATKPSVTRPVTPPTTQPPVTRPVTGPAPKPPVTKPVAPAPTKQTVTKPIGQ